MRFFAAMAVVLFHYVPTSIRETVPEWAANIISNGSRVTLFFILSGFILSYNYAERKHLDLRSFWVGRISRLYPCYLLGFLLVAPWYVYHRFTIDPIASAAGKTIGAAAIHLLMVQAWDARTMYVWNGPAWSLSVEVFFYALFPLMAYLLRPLRSRSAVVCIVIIAFGTSLIPTSLSIWFPTHHWDFQVLYNNPLFCLPLFVFGIGIGKYFTHWPVRAAGGWIVNASVVGLVGIFSSGIGMRWPVVSTALMIAAMGSLIYGLAGQRGTIAGLLSRGPIVTLGQASYALYILQVPVAYWLKGFMNWTPGMLMVRNVDLFSPHQFAIYLCCVISVSLLVTRYIDTPVRTAFQRVFSRPTEKLAKVSTVHWNTRTPDLDRQPVL